MNIGQADAPHAITPSDKERKAGLYSARNLQRVLGGLHRDGLVVLKDVIDVKLIDALNEVMCADAERLVADPKQEFNHNVKCEMPLRPVDALPPRKASPSRVSQGRFRCLFHSCCILDTGLTRMLEASQFPAKAARAQAGAPARGHILQLIPIASRSRVSLQQQQHHHQAVPYP